MKRTVKYWTPRILCILFIAVATVQAVHTLGEGYETWKTILSQQSDWHRWGLLI
jgi:hypothetical protein